MPTLEIRHLTPDDLPHLRSLLLAYRFLFDGQLLGVVAQDDLVEMFLAQVRKQSAFFGSSFIAIQNGQIKGVLFARDSEWDTGHFGFNMARVELVSASGDEHTILAALIRHYLEEAYVEGVEPVAVRANTEDCGLIGALEVSGFKLMVIKLMTHFAIHRSAIHDHQAPANIAFRLLQRRQTQEVCDLLDVSQLDSRFYADHRFPSDKVDAMYRKWINGICREHPDWVILVERDDELAGYIAYTPYLPAYTETVPGLRAALVNMVAVVPEHQGHGLGVWLLHELQRRLRNDRFDIIYGQVALTNLPSLNTFLRAGFRAGASTIDFHWWAQ